MTPWIQFNLLASAHLNIVNKTRKQLHIQHTLTGRFTPRPHSVSLTCASIVSHQVVACVTTVGGCLSKCCSSSVTNLSIGWVSQSVTVNHCWRKDDHITIMCHIQYLLSKITRQTFHDRGARLSEQCIPWRARTGSHVYHHSSEVSWTKVKQRPYVRDYSVLPVTPRELGVHSLSPIVS